jgi:hypothetical protein
VEGVLTDDEDYEIEDEVEMDGVNEMDVEN